MAQQLTYFPNPSVPYELVYEGEHYAVINKPPNLITQPRDTSARDTLLNGLFARWGKALQRLGKRRDFGLLHRLDRGTSGLVIVGLTPLGYDHLRAQFERRTIQKEYWALVMGRPQPSRGRCELWIREERRGGGKRARISSARSSSVESLGGAQRALTLYKTLSEGRAPLSSGEPVSLIACRIETGRLHQIRAHMSALGHPVLGDFDYGGPSDLNRFARGLKRDALALHAVSVTLSHPLDDSPTRHIATPSEYFQQLARSCELSLR